MVVNIFFRQVINTFFGDILFFSYNYEVFDWCITKYTFLEDC